MECHGKMKTKWTVGYDFMSMVFSPSSSKGFQSTGPTINTYMVGIKYSQTPSQILFQLQEH